MAIEVRTAADLDNVRSNPSGEYIQKDNIDLTGYNWTPIPTFTGVYDGNNYAINNFYISRSPSQQWVYYALFRTTSGATIKNIRVIDANLQLPYDKITDYGGSGVAIIAGESSGTTFENCFASGVINASGNGGICYDASACNFSKCAAKVDFTGFASFFGNYGGSSYDIETQYEGSGITGVSRNGTTIKDCYSRVTYLGGNKFSHDLAPVGRWVSGGISAVLLGGSSIENCYTTGINTIVDPVKTEGSISKSYYDVNVGGGSGGNGTSRTTDEMTFPEDFGTTYIDWDFETIWKHDPSYTINDGYPHFGIGFRIWVAKDLAPELLPGKWIEWEVVPSLWVYKEFAWKPITGVWVRKGDEWKSI